MTNTEALDFIHDIEWCDICKISRHCDNAMKDKCLEMRDRVIDALEMQERFKWHVIGESSDDLPEDGEQVLCYYENKFASCHYYEFGEYTKAGNVFPNADEYDLDFWKVIAWKPLEKFGEEYIFPHNSDHRKQRGRTAPNRKERNDE